MTSEDTHLVGVAGLQKGTFVELEPDWMSYSTPSGRSKIGDPKQIDAMPPIDLSRVRKDPANSKSVLVPSNCTVAVFLKNSDCVADSAQFYRETVELAALHFKINGVCGLTLAGASVADVAEQDEFPVGLLANVSGYKSVIHPINSNVLSLRWFHFVKRISAKLVIQGRMKSSISRGCALNPQAPRLRISHFVSTLRHLENGAIV